MSITPKNPEYRVIAAIKKLQTDTNCPAGKSWPNHVKNEQHIGSEKTYGPQNTEQLNIVMRRTANENAACIRRICKRSFTDLIYTGSIFICGPLHYYVQLLSDSRFLPPGQIPGDPGATSWDDAIFTGE